jgi:hypothetical protein
MRPVVALGLLALDPLVKNVQVFGGWKIAIASGVDLGTVPRIVTHQGHAWRDRALRANNLHGFLHFGQGDRRIEVDRVPERYPFFVRSRVAGAEIGGGDLEDASDRDPLGGAWRHRVTIPSLNRM